jgi:peptidoglycan/LPS O-acetylase OafA/YrhL
LRAGLDVARAAAACYVVVHHVVDARGWSHGAGLLFRFGQEAVIVFFLLSGFVIFANERERALSPRGYYWRRLRRIYPALIAAMLVSTAVALDNGDLARRFDLGALLGTLASVQDIAALKPGVATDPYLGNQPLWSLSYEMAFYLAFPLVLRAWRARPGATEAIVGASCCLAYALYAIRPNHAALVVAYFQLWWCGAMAADAYGRGARDVRAMARSLGWLAALSATAAVVVVVVGYRGLGFYPVLPLRHFATGLVLVLLLGNRVGAALASRCLVVAAPAAAVASISYGLYVLHYPLLVDWHRAGSPIGLAQAAVVLVAGAWAADRGLDRLLPRAPRD